MESGGIASRNLQIRLLGHCIICLRKLNVKRKGTRLEKNIGYFKVDDDDGDNANASPEIAPKSVVSTSSFLTTFNQIWRVLYIKWQGKITPVTKDTNGLLEDIGVSLENILETGVTTNVSFSRAPTICKSCSDKVLAVENLIKAVRQQVRELGMLLEEGRRRQDGGLGDFEKSLRGNKLEESVIRATLQFVGIFGSSQFSKNVFEGDQKVDKCSGEGQLGGTGAEDDGEDPNYLKSEEDDLVTGQDESGEEMEVDEEENINDTDYEVKKDPLASFLEKCKMDNSESVRQLSEEQEANEDHSKIRCSCGKMYKNQKSLRSHMQQNRKSHPEYESFVPLGSQRQICELCGEWVMFSDILQHYTDHLNGQAEWVLRCPNEKCSCMYVSLLKLQRHFNQKQCTDCMKAWKEKGGNLCDICGFKGTNLLKLRNHVREKHEEREKEKKLRCPISGCGKMFCVKQSVHFHLNEHRYQPPITEQVCDKCGEKFKFEEMEGHLKEEHGIEEVIGCGQCEMRFSGRDEMVEHLFEHRGTGIFCDICGDKQGKFGRYSHFREHYFGVHKLCPKRYRCGEGDCENWFWRKETKEDHELRMHREESNVGRRFKKKEREKKKVKYFECDMCTVKFVMENNLTEHQIKVHGADPFKCDICGETFNEKQKLNKHKKGHAGIPVQREWKCEVEGCGKIFKEKRFWKRHLETGHGAVKKHVCEICGKGYTDQQTLKDHHDIVHLGLRPWVCDECGERFTSSTVLTRHKLIHTGERPFGCDICGQRFRQKEVLRRHMRGHEEKGAGFKPNGPMKQIRKRKAQDL